VRFARRTALARCLLVGAVLSPLPRPLSAQTAADIVDRMLSRFTDSAAAVDNYTVVQEILGTRTELYFEKEMADGYAVFHLRGSSAGAATENLERDVGYADVYTAAPQMAEHARYAGLETVDGVEAHVLAIDDLSRLDLMSAPVSDQGEFVPRSGRILIDAQRWVPRRMEFVGDLDTGTDPAEVTSVIDFLEYEDALGLLVPRLTTVRMEGLSAAIDDETRAQLEEMRRQLEEMPPAQRAMVEEMFQGRLAEMEALLSDDGAPLTIEIRVVEVRVNEGAPR